MMNYQPLGGIQPRFGSGNPFALGAPGFGGMPGYGKKKKPVIGMRPPIPLGAPMRPQFPQQIRPPMPQPIGLRPQQFMRNPFMGQMRPY